MSRTFHMTLNLIHFFWYCHVTLQIDFKQISYSLTSLCNVPLDPNDVTGRVRGEIDCGALCLNSSDCAAFAFTEIKGCSLYVGDLSSAVYCSVGDANMTSLYVKVDELPVTLPSGPPPPTPPCYNGGTYDQVSSKCQCVGGWVGANCNETAAGCLELSDAGYRDNGPYTVHPSTSPQPFEVYCSLSLGHGLTVIQHRFTTTSDFNRPWQEYKDGFKANGWTDFWLGNDRIHYLTSSNAMRLVVQLTNDSSTYQRYYDNFIMADESSSFAVTYTTSWSFSAEDAMEDCWPSTSLPFSTHDNDNDNETTVNCAATRHGGWWFESSPNCTLCNLNGVFLKGAKM